MFAATVRAGRNSGKPGSNTGYPSVTTLSLPRGSILTRITRNLHGKDIVAPRELNEQIAILIRPELYEIMVGLLQGRRSATRNDVRIWATVRAPPRTVADRHAGC